jgi:DNA-binding NarL/FixJ family response regulator
LLTQTTKVMVLELGGGVASRALVGARGLAVLTVRSYAEAVRAAPVLRPRALVVAFGQPETRDVESVGLLVNALEGVPVLIVSEPVNAERIVGLVKAGVKGYLFTRDAGHLAESVRELVRGGLPMSEPVSALVLGRARRPSGEFGMIARATSSTPPASAERTLVDTPRLPSARQGR